MPGEGPVLALGDARAGYDAPTRPGLLRRIRPNFWRLTGDSRINAVVPTFLASARRSRHRDKQVEVDDCA